MQPISHVVKPATLRWGDEDVMTSRPKVAIRIAQCIGEYAYIESTIGIFLAALLDTESKAVLAMYSALESRAAQGRMIMAAAASKLSPSDFDLLQAVMRV